MIQKIIDQGILFEPGEKSQYSNSNYIHLSLILEDITGKSFEMLLQDQICSKAGLSHTLIQDYDDVVNSYSRKTDSWLEEPKTHPTIPLGAGAIASTASEVSKFLQVLFDTMLISETGLRSMTILSEGYGRGIFQFPFYNYRSWGHNGKIDGFEAMCGYFPHDGTSFALLANGLDYDMNDIVIGILSLYYGMPYTIPSFESVALSVEELSGYAGTYTSFLFPLKITLFVENGKLMGQASGQEAFPLRTKSKQEFVNDTYKIRITFSGDNQNEFELTQNGSRYSFTRN